MFTCGSFVRIYRIVVFFFKQKTAYEMRISDWSSDVCSSDLPVDSRPRRARRGGGAPASGAVAGECPWRDRVGRGGAAIAPHPTPQGAEIGRASCRERVCQYV